MQGDALRAYITDVHYGTVTVSDSERSLSVLSVELRLIVVVVYTWSATVMSRALQNIMRSVQQKLLNISKVDGQRSAMVLLRWPRSVADVDGQGSGGRHHIGGKQRVDIRRAQIRCRRRRKERGQHGAWLTAGGQATIERRRTVGKTCKPTAQIEPKSRVARFWLVSFIPKTSVPGYWIARGQNVSDFPHFSLKIPKRGMRRHFQA